MKTSKLIEARENVNDEVAIVLSFHLIGRENGANFLQQLESKVE